MIKHGISKEYEYENTTDEIIKVRLMDDSVEKHERMVLLNPDDYNSWNYLKRQFLNGKKEDFERQMKLTQKAIEENPKSYHSWFHRYLFFNKMNNNKDDKILVEDEELIKNKINNNKDEINKNKDEDDEIKLCSLLLKFDPRNFHCWNYCKKNHFRIKTDLHNFTSMHYDEFDENILFLDPNDEGGWRIFERREKIAGRMRIDQRGMEIVFEDPFKGMIKIKGNEINIDRPTKRVFLSNNNSYYNSNSSNNKDSYYCNSMGKDNNSYYNSNSNIKDSYCNGDVEVVYIKRYDESVNYKIIKDSLPDLIVKILELEPNCIYALKHKMIYSQDDEERKKIAEILKEEDPLRKNYYEYLCKDKYEQYLIY